MDPIAEMNKRRLSKILVNCDMALLKKLSGQAEALEKIRIERAPQTSLVMMKTRDSVSMQPFYMGEVLVTECAVSVRNTFGIGVVIGEQPERAYRIAVIDAALNAGLPAVKDWSPVLEAAEKRMTGQRKLEHARASASKVNFDTMGEFHDQR
ncbi:phosphonate C-P lyase system protein PhnG [Sporolactobacillus sp. CQH2019]|uniref:phosphonate C-P lyase system protein PhnG n=1 Tax=Sporolactobacillus sp. CQH2019 TaxID=3023512 RepID=UPI002368E95B|nr:phosphonate C-P lyase system protein PhnG [Sporolactobacillus sp. CQH2019]MDD9150024.1 phosphonate C-P lyase system protein PhnG [Sporolactobacillus sp. CQH2019]